MRYSVEVEKPSEVVRKFTIKVPAEEVQNRFNAGLATVQKTAKIKGFRPGHVPISVVKQYYGEDVRHQVFHGIIDESFEKAVVDQKVRAISRPKIETPGASEHDHSTHHLDENKDFTFVAEFEIVPDVKVKSYTGFSLKKEKADVASDQVDDMVSRLHQSQAQLEPLQGGIALADGTSSVRPCEKGDFADLEFKGGIVEDGNVNLRDDMKGQQLVEIGSGSFIPGFEDEVIGMRNGDTKTFRISFPEDYHAKELAEKVAEFTVTLNEIKVKKLPELDDEFAKGMGYEGLEDLKSKTKAFLEQESTKESTRKLRSDLLSELIKKNPVTVPQSLVEAQTRELAQELAQELKQQGADEKMMQGLLTQELPNLKLRAENQVKASLLLEAVAKEESISVSSDDLKEEFKRLATALKVEEEKLLDYYEKNPSKKDDVEFRLRQDKTLEFVLSKAKVKEVAPEKPKKA